MALDGGFLHNLIAELSASATDARVDKIFQPSRDELVLVLRSPGFNKRLLISAGGAGARLHYTNHAPENPKTAPMLCMLLRKYLGGSKIVSIEGVGLERVVKIQFEARNEMGDTIYPSLVVELISGSANIIFLDSEGLIVDSVRRSDIEKQTRLVAPGARYTLPPKKEKLCLSEHSKEALADAVIARGSMRLCDAILAVADGVSPLVARELATYCVGDLDKTAEDTPKERLCAAFDMLSEYLKNGRPTLLLNEKNEPTDFSYLPITQYGNAFHNKEYESFSALLDDYYYERDIAARMRRQSQDILKLLNVLSARLTRRTAARKNDLKKCADREKCRVYGELIKANIYAIHRGDSVAEVINYYDEDQSTVRIPLNVSLSPADNAQRYFKEYKKRCVAEKTLQGLIKDSEAELRYIDSVFDALSRAETSEDLAAIREELQSGSYLKRQGQKSRKPMPQKPLKFFSSDGFTIFVGKNNLQNDELTLKLAQKTDLWFHTKNIHGSHVILKLDGKAPTKQAVLEAATLAAYHSKAKNGSKVPVDYTPVKYVKKPAGARPGMVIYTTNQTVYVTPTEEFIHALRGNSQ